jgi:hypothetical protein
MPRIQIVRVAVLALASSFVVTSAARAQAWLPAKGEGSVSVLYQNIFVTDHMPSGEFVDFGHIYSHGLLADLTYGLTDRVALTLGVPVMVTKYKGDRPHPTVLDDGTWHSSWQDFRFALRYNAVRGPVAITPFVGTVLPSNAYETYAHSAVGRRLRELQVGVSFAALLDGLLPGLFVQGRYALGFSENVLDISTDRSLADMEIGYFVTPELRVFGLVGGYYQYEGIDLPVPPISAASVLTPEQLVNHDRIVKDRALNLGAGLSVALTDSIDLYGSFIKTVAGRNGHAINRGISAGVSWSFKRKGPEQTARGRERSLVRCLCQKSAS